MIIVLLCLLGTTIVSIGACILVPKKSLVVSYPLILKCFAFIEGVLFLLVGFLMYVNRGGMHEYVFWPCAVFFLFILIFPQTALLLLVRYIRAVNTK